LKFVCVDALNCAGLKVVEFPNDPSAWAPESVLQTEEKVKKSPPSRMSWFWSSTMMYGENPVEVEDMDDWYQHGTVYR
jgi:hypothetical protein